MSVRAQNKSLVFCAIALGVTLSQWCALSLFAQPITGQRSELAAQLDVLDRLDRNLDGLLDHDEIPQQVMPYARSLVRQIYSMSRDPSFVSKGDASSEFLALHLQQLRNKLSQIADSDLERRSEASSQQLVNRVSYEDQSILLLLQYDSNRDGVLTSSELDAFSGQWKVWDYNNDGKIEPRELKARFQNMAEASQTHNAGQDSIDKPTRFSSLDRDRDGQIQMAEFASNWTRKSADEYRRWDSNNDGVITLEEWHQHQVDLDKDNDE